MTEHRATIHWQRGDARFLDREYKRQHLIDFGNGQTLQASAAPDFAGDPGCVDPEQALVASASSCHMLTFLAVASLRKLIVEEYSDAAVGELAKNEQGQMAVTRITLHPRVRFASDTPVADEELARLHERAHKNCFIANSIRSEILVA